MIESIELVSEERRLAAIREAGFNTFLLKSKDVFIDLLTDSGTNAMSQEQWAAMMLGDEAYAGAKSFDKFQESIAKVYGFPLVVPTHQGRGAEHLLSQSWIKPGQLVPGNMYFTTTRFHQEYAGGVFKDVICDEGHKVESAHPFKGNVDIEKLDALVREHGAEAVAYVSVGAPVNMAGGQPVSLQNMQETAEFCRKHKIRMVLDAARAVENAWMIKKREASQSGRKVAEILWDMCECFDAMSMSAKKDPNCNIGGWLATRDEALYESAAQLCVVFEGLHTYGGLAGRDLEALAVGIEQCVDDASIAFRVRQVEFLGQSLQELGVPIVTPIGGHAVFVDARAFLPHLEQEALPAQALCAHIYTHSGVRAMERGIVSAGRDANGENRKPALELVRLALPRRVYTQGHLVFVAEKIGELYEKRHDLGGLKFKKETEKLRFFQSTFESV
jgi:tyrosine phenol-lyase